MSKSSSNHSQYFEETMSEIVDVDSFVVGIRDEQKVVPLDYCLPKVIEYMKKTGKSFDELTDEERAMCK